MMLYKFLLALALFQVAACNAKIDTSFHDDDSQYLAQLTTFTIPASLSAAAKAYQFDYVMSSIKDKETTARALLFEPNAPTPLAGFPLIIWAHGTTGIANSCTPSISFERFANTLAINDLLSAGYAVLAPDFEGFGLPYIHPYYIRASHARSVISAIPAAHRIKGANLSQEWAIVGHSQGGHVALASARAEQASEYPLKAVVALAPGTDIKPFSQYAFAAIDSDIAAGKSDSAESRLLYLNIYSTYVAHAYGLLDSTIDPKSFFGNTMAALIKTVVDEPVCGEYAQLVADAIAKHVSGGGVLNDFEGLKRNWYDQPAITKRLDIEALNDEAQPMPLFIVQGDSDRQVPVAATTAFVDQQKALGTNVTYTIVPGARHTDVGKAHFSLTLTWLAKNFPAR